MQAAVVITVCLVISLFLKFLSVIKLFEVEALNYWITSATFLLFYALFNSLLSLSSKNQNAYWGQSIFSFMAVVIITGFVAYLLSSLSIYEAASMKWIYMVLTLVYIIFLTIVRLMRTIVQIAIKQDKKLRGEE